MKEPTGSNGPVLQLTNNRNTDSFYEWLQVHEDRVLRWEAALDVDAAKEIDPSFAASFNYRHIIDANAIAALECEIVNVHCSVLPWNRGANPSFFSYYENTPKGVTVHKLSEGLDKGDVLLQRILELDGSETFASSYGKLLDCACDLLRSNWADLKVGAIIGAAQDSGGTYHSAADFENARSVYPFEWDDVIDSWKVRNGLR